MDTFLNDTLCHHFGKFLHFGLLPLKTARISIESHRGLAPTTEITTHAEKLLRKPP